MVDPTHDASPLKGDIASSIYSYQTRLLRNTDGAGSDSPPSTPSGSSGNVHRTLSRMNSLREDVSVTGLRRAGSGARIGSHNRGGKSVDLVRGQWEAKIEAASTVTNESVTTTPPGRPRSMLLPSMASRFGPSSPAKDESDSRNSLRDRPHSIIGSPSRNHAAVEVAKTEPASSVEIPPFAAVANTPAKDIVFEPTTLLPATDFAPLVSEGDNSTMSKTRSAADTLAEARANALRRLQAKKKAGLPVEEPKVDLPPEIPIPPLPLEIVEPKNISKAVPTTPKALPTAPSQAKAQSSDAKMGVAALKADSSVVNAQETLPKLPKLPQFTPNPKQALPPSSPQTPQQSPFGERLRPASRIEEIVTKSDSSTSPFGERLRPVARPAEVSTPESKVEFPTLRKTKSIDVGRPTSPSKLLPKSPKLDDIPKPEHPALRKAKSNDIKSIASPSKLLPRETSTPKSNPPAFLTSTPKETPPARTAKTKQFGDIFNSPQASPGIGSPSKWANMPHRAPTAPPKNMVSSLASRFSTSEEDAPSTPRGRVPSLSSDRRQLGKHLPRIVSGDPGWEGDQARRTSRTVSRLKENKPASRPTISVSTEENTPPANAPTPHSLARASLRSPAKTPGTPSRNAPLTPSATINREQVLKPITPSKSTPKSHLMNSIGSLTSPRAEVAGEEMKDLMSVISAAPARKANAGDGDGVTGMSNRLRLSQSQRLPLAASSATLAPAPLPSRRLVNNNNWMDRQRHALAAYEYLCHVGEAQQWIEGCLDEELEFGVTEMEDGLRDGVVLAKLARAFQGEQVVRRIWTEAKHQYRQTDNINYFFNFVRSVGMPETFMFELTDLYNKKNVPKVIFCIHVLSHLLARLGRAERMNNLLGQFEFTDEQLEATQKGIQGVAMPNFQQVAGTLAKEASWEPEPEEEVETEDEIRDRLLLEREGSITALQRQLRGTLARQRISRVKAQLKLATPIVVQIQSCARANMTRQTRKTEKRSHGQLGRWASGLQAVSRAHLARGTWQQHTQRVHSTIAVSVVGIQAQARGVLARIRRSTQDNELDRIAKGIAGLQATSRGWLVRRSRKTDKKMLAERATVQSVTSMQAVLRARLTRQAKAKEQRAVEAHSATWVKLQGHLRSALVRRQHKAREQKMDDATDYVVAIQSAARGVLARRRKHMFTREAVTVSTAVVSLQALARARIAKRTHESMQKVLAKVEIAGSVGGLQAFLRTKLAKRQTVEQKKKLEFVQPDVIGFQAVARGYLARQEYHEWRDYLLDPHTQGALVFLQSLVRGFISRRRHWMRVAYLHRNVDKIVKIQAIWRGRTQRQMYDRLITGGGVDVITIQHYMHLLDDTENDFRDQLRIDTLRKEVVELLRTNQTLETEVQELDTKISLILKNKMSFEDLVRAKRRHGVNTGDESFHHPGGGDPFTNVHLDRTSQRKLELFEHLFFTLQTEPTYLCRLLHKLAADDDLEKDRRLVEGVTLILFGFGHDRREEYLFHKLIQISVHEQILRSRSLEQLADTRFAMVPVVTQFVKPLLTPYLQTVLRPHIERVIMAEELDLSVDPVEIYNRILNAEESLTGMKSDHPRDLTADQILQSHVETRTLYIQHLQELRALTDQLAKALMAATAQMPYTVRLIAREALFACRVRFQDEDDSTLWPVVAKTVVLPFILPAIVAPEIYGIAESVNPVQRRNLSVIANLLTYVVSQDFTNPDKDRLMRVPLNEYIRAEGQRMSDWVLDVAEVDFQVQEMLESTSEARPISITRSDIYGLLAVLIRNMSALSAGRHSDPIESVLTELEGPPLDYDRGASTVRVRLTNRLAQLQPSDPYQAQVREMEVQAKRHVLAVLRVQSGQDLYEVLLKHPSDEDEARWIQEVHRDIALEQARLARHDLPPTPVEAEYQMESIRALTFSEVKSRAIEFCMALVEEGRLSREDKFQGLLISIAGDIKEKHRLRQKRKVDLRAMSDAHAHLSEKRQKCEEQIQTYHDYIDTAMAQLQQKKKASFMSKQYWHQKRGGAKKSKFGSYKYTAAELYEKGILLSVNQYSPRQFDKINIVISSDDVGVFALEMSHPSGVSGREELRMEDLLQAQFDNNVRLDLFDGMAAFNLNVLIHQINKKFYAS